MIIPQIDPVESIKPTLKIAAGFIFAPIVACVLIAFVHASSVEEISLHLALMLLVGIALSWMMASFLLYQGLVGAARLAVWVRRRGRDET